MLIPNSGLTVREIEADLDGLGVPFDPRWPKFALLIQRNIVKARRNRRQTRK